MQYLLYRAFKHIDSRLLIETAQRMGFGRSIPLALGMTVSGGSLQTEEDLSLPAEKANMSFGQESLRRLRCRYALLQPR